MIILFFVVGGLCLFSGVLSAAETSLTAASRIRLHQLNNQGFGHAETALSLQKNMTQVIATLLLANTMSLTSLTALATTLFTQWMGEVGVFYAALLLSAFITIYLEVLPKIFVFSRAERVSMGLAPFVSVLVKVFKPLTRLVDSLAHMSLKIFGFSTQKGATQLLGLEELRGAIDLYHPTDGTSNERVMLKNILDLTQVTVSEVMIHRNHMFSLNKKLETKKLISRALGSPFTRIPLWQGDPETIVGLLHIKALARALEKEPEEPVDISKIQTEPWFIPETTTLTDQLRAFKERREHFSFVVNEYGALTGMVTLEDILEEIVGDIQDEHDAPIAGVTPLAKNRFLVDGSMTLRDLSRNHGWHFSDTKPTTLAGLILDIAGYIPKTRQTFHVDHFSIKVVEKRRNQITRLEVTLHPTHASNHQDKAT